MLGQAAKIAVELLVPVRESTEVREMFDLIDIARTQATAIDLLQGYQIEITEQIANPLQIAAAPGMRQKMLPAARQVVVITLGTDTDLDVETEQPQTAILRPFIRWRATWIDLWIAQVNRPSGRPTPEHYALSAHASYCAARSLAIR